MSGLHQHGDKGELHGITVVLSGASGRTYLGRWHEMGARGVVMKNVAIHDPATNELSLDIWLINQRKFGIDATEKMYIVPHDEAGNVTPFG